VASYLQDHGKVAQGHVVPDKLVAVRAGVGWYGKNGVVQTTRFGSWIILRSLVTDAKLEGDEELKNDCGACEACIKACPTSTIVEPYVVDVGRCINYFSARKGDIPESLRGLMGNHIACCDDCLEACPKNKKIVPTLRQVKPIRLKYGNSPSLISLLKVSETEFQEEFYDLDWAEPKLKYILRDTAVASGNSEDKSVIREVNKLLKNPDETVRNHASWAAKKLTTTT
jgi:epoxyqueuosine reductase